MVAEYWWKARRAVNRVGARAMHWLGSVRLPFLPGRLDVEPTNICNLRCPHCQVPYRRRESARLSEAAFLAILEQLPLLASVKLQGQGEPMLNPQLAAMLHLGESRGLQMHVITNGSLCEGKAAADLLSLRHTRITFSVDGASAAVFERVRVGSDFARICANIRELVRLRGSRAYPAIAVRTTLTKDNVHELPGIVALVDDLGVRQLTVSAWLTDRGRDEMRPRIESASIANEADLEARLADACRGAQQRGVEFRVLRPGVRLRRGRCVWPWASAFIAANGDVVPCCIIGNSDTAKMGNVLEDGFSGIWNGAAYRELRTRMADRDPPGFCRGCYAAARPEHAGGAGGTEEAV